LRSTVTARLLHVARRSLARLENWQLRQDYLAPQDPAQSSVKETTKADRLISNVSFELEQLRALGHTSRLEYLLQLLHLSYTYSEGPQASKQRAQQLSEAIFALGKNDGVYDPAKR